MEKFKKIIESNRDVIELGKIDQREYKKLYSNVSKIALNNPIFKKAFELSTYWQQTKITKIKSSRNLIENYAKGIGVSSEQIYSSLIIPEMVSSFNKWTPNLLGLIPGCSSLFARDKESGGIIHARVLDYSLGILLSDSERALHIKNESAYDVFGFTSAGFPIPSLSSINEKGLSLAIHYKYGNYFDIEGSSIFEIAYDLLCHCKNIKEVKSRLKRHKSISHWGLYMSDQNGNVASVDIRGNEIHTEVFQMNDYDFLYFNNKVMSHDKVVENSQPYGHLSQCSMRRKSLEKNFSKFSPNSLEEYLETLCHIESNQKEYNLSPLTIASVQAYALDNKSFAGLYILGETPKLPTSSKTYSSNVFESKFEVTREKQPKTNFQRGLKHLSRSQYFIDLKDYEQVYFHLQMAIFLLKGTHEEYISKFYFNVIEYINVSVKEDLYYLLTSFQKLHSKLPSYLKDHCKLFEFRILKLLGEQYDYEHFIMEIKNNNLNNIFKNESKLKVFSLKMFKKLIYPRIELLDIIYAYS